MSNKIQTYAANEAGGKFQPFEYDAGELGKEQVEVRVSHCGVCRSDLLMLNNEWQITEYPFVGGHEVIGVIAAMGENTKGLEIGDKVGIGWNSATCGHCDNCISGYHINCPNLEGLIVGRYGGFADRVRCNWDWAVKLPEKVNVSKAGPLFCGGITVFNPFVQNDIKPTDKIGVVGIGGLGHLALQFADKWGCEVTAFSTSPDKADDAKDMGADYIIDAKSDSEIKKLMGKFDMILVTADVSLNWELYFKTLASKGKLHVVGAVMEPISLMSFNFIPEQKSLTGTATGSPFIVRKMLEFSARHNIETITEDFKMSEINDAFLHMESGKSRYRVVLQNDF